MNKPWFPTLLVLLLAGSAVVAQSDHPSSRTADSRDALSKWGLRVGVATRPDQIVGGVTFLETEIASHVFLEPDVEVGVGDDVTVVSGTAGFHYRFKVDAKVQPYAGGGATVGFIDSDFEAALRATGGIHWSLKGGTEMLGEVNVILGDLHRLQLMVGWRF